MGYRVTSSSALLAALAVVSCGNPSSTGDRLTEAEAAELAAAVAQAGFLGAPGGFGPQHSPAEPSDRVTVTINETNSCEAGGTAALSGSVTVEFNQQTGSGTMVYDYTMTPSNCALRTGSGRVFTLSGDPNLSVKGQLNLSQTSWRGSVNYGGGFRWRSDDGRAGACRVSMQATYDFTFSETSVTGTATVSGDFCGHSVNRTGTVTVSG
jgi:hypothetical protein